MPGPTLPPFPDDVRTHPFLIIDYELIKAGDKDEENRLWKAATTIGFWYLKNHGADQEVSDMFDMGAETMALPCEERMKFEQGDEGQSFGYKKAGANAVDAAGKNLDTAEYINISKDDALAYSQVVHRTYPSTVNSRMENTIAPFVRKALAVNYVLLNIFNEKLGLPQGTLERLHAVEEHSGSEARCIRNPPQVKEAAGGLAIGAHTDFGSLTLLHNRLGGLQVMPPGHDEWSFVRPIPEHAICNIGDALSLFSGGILQSNIHRVVPPPGAQVEYERWSLAFFTRPGNSKILRALIESSPLIAEAVKQQPDRKFETGSTAAAWSTRRFKNSRIHNRTGPETWAASRGTEHTV
ncbi:Clavaminate synthase-like protein [Rhizopogon vinicolor AM-OR11-026]|uniref:Clavaminate synthase-like protein n=1 Tax=Rhizopogon vinicolor AM-OR11-026 TaxID=1314800 RepID=A0A1B7MGD7_9AGAM|nr:Clavaminate synthase-like protein [Rhizopogon vinicolor AM-OR11-026]